MRKILLGISMFVCLFACKNPKSNIDSFRSISAMVDSARSGQVDTLVAEPVEEVPKPIEADELFDDFIFYYATDTAFQRQRTVFPLPYYKGDTPLKIEKKYWKHDPLFADQTCYTLLFDNEEDMELVGDTSLTSVQVEWIYLKTRTMKRYYFERNKGVWMLEAINLRKLEDEHDGEQDFASFYARFAVDSVYQREHIHEPLTFVTVDPDDEFAILETTLDIDQWYVFRPALPADRLSNIDYGQRNDDHSSNKILKVNGMSNGYSTVFYFRRRGGEWELYKYEDTGI